MKVCVQYTGGLEFDTCAMNEVCAIWCKSLDLVSVYVIFGAVLNFARKIRCFALWVCGFENCVKCL